MTEPACRDDAPNELWQARLDAYLTAIQTNHLEEQDRLLKLEPELAQWTDSFRDIDDFARLFGEHQSAAKGDHQKIDFGKYRLLGELGRGGMGVVFEAYQPDLDRTVALKMLTGNVFASPDQRRRFAQEARLASRIRHPQIVTIHDVGEIGGQPYFTMDYISGTSLAARLRDGAWPVERAVELLIQVARAVNHLHRNGVIHRDLKPSNILINEKGQAFLVDFGLAKAIDEIQDATVTGTILGTPSYMSPEQAAGRVHEIKEQSDVYSLGAIMYELLCGRPPFQTGSSFDTVLLVLEQEPIPPRHWNRAISKSLEQICLKCLEKSPERRYASAEEFAIDLERWSHGEYPAFASRSPFFHLVRTIRRYPAASYRLLALIPSLLIVIMRCVIKGDYWDYYSPVMAELCLWMGFSVIWEVQSHVGQRRYWTKYAFLFTDISFLTAILRTRQHADNSHVMAYVLIILMAGLSLNRRLIWISGLGCILGYSLLVGLGEGLTDWHLSFITAVLLACCTLVVDYQVRRLSVWIQPRNEN